MPAIWMIDKPLAATGTDLGTELSGEVAGMGYEMLGMDRWSSGRVLMIRVYIDQQGGVTLADCERVAVQLQGILRLHYPLTQEAPRLEVSSPGLDRPLFTIEHYARFIGLAVRVSLRVKREDGRRRLVGRIVSAGDAGICLHTEAGDITLSLEEIEKARLVPEWKDGKVKKV